ncbi:hypothetical protein SprV_0501880000 [Sparganum proliferum]
MLDIQLMTVLAITMAIAHPGQSMGPITWNVHAALVNKEDFPLPLPNRFEKRGAQYFKTSSANGNEYVMFVPRSFYTYELVKTYRKPLTQP